MTDDDMSWRNKKMPAGSQPLTREWYKMVTTPRFNERGERSYMLTPPSGDHLPGRMIGTGIIVIVLLVFSGLIVLGTASAWLPR